MARVFVTGSADGLGKMAAELLIEQGHKVVLHARSAARADETRNKVVGAEDIVVGAFRASRRRNPSPSRSTGSAGSTPSSTMLA
jgi:NAD(P)-dependent dehydrogenase (short-subunit alcohol dehydrogenase family)